MRRGTVRPGKPRRSALPFALVFLILVMIVAGGSGSRAPAVDTQAAADEILSRCRALIGQHDAYAQCIDAGAQSFIGSASKR